MSGIYLRAEMGNGDLYYYAYHVDSEDHPFWMDYKPGSGISDLVRPMCISTYIGVYRAIVRLSSERRSIKHVCFSYQNCGPWNFLYDFKGFSSKVPAKPEQQLDWAVFEGQVLKHTGDCDNCIDFVKTMPMPPERGVTIRKVGPAHKVAREVVVTVEEPT